MIVMVIYSLIFIFRMIRLKECVIIFIFERLWFIVKIEEVFCYFLNSLNVIEFIFLLSCED